MRGLAPSCERRRELPENVSDAANGRGRGSRGNPLHVPSEAWYNVTIPKPLTHL